MAQFLTPKTSWTALIGYLIIVLSIQLRMQKVFF